MRFKMITFNFSYVTFLWLMGSVCAVIDNQDLENTIENVCSEFPKFAHKPEGINALRDVLPDIFQHLSIKDLHSVKQVFSTFYNEAGFILSQRGPELGVIPITKYTNCPRCGKSETIKHLSKTIKVRPKITLFFLNKLTPPAYYYNSIPYELITHYMPELPRDCIILNVLGYRVIYEVNEIDVVDDRVLSLFIPERRGVDVRQYVLRGNHLRKSICADGYVIDDYFDQLQPNMDVHSKSNPYGMIFFNLDNRYMTDRRQIKQAILKRIRESPLSGNFSLWGSSVRFMSTTADFPAAELNIFGTTLSGPKVKCWSLVIHTGDPEHFIKEKIKNFKVRVNVVGAKKSIALSTQITYNLESNESLIEKNKIFRNYFPNVGLVIFAHKSGEIYCLDIMDESGDEKPQIVYKEHYICYMIISYF